MFSGGFLLIVRLILEGRIVEEFLLNRTPRILLKGNFQAVHCIFEIGGV